MLVDTPMTLRWFTENPKGRELFRLLTELPEVSETELLLDNFMRGTGQYTRSFNEAIINPEKIGRLGWSPNKFAVHEHLGGHPMHSKLPGKLPFLPEYLTGGGINPATEGYAMGMQDGIFPIISPSLFKGTYESRRWGPWQSVYDEGKNLGFKHADQLINEGRPMTEKSITEVLKRIFNIKRESLGLPE
jgi:hypothetical protein